MSDNKEKLQDALGMLDDDLLLEVEKLRRMPQKKAKLPWQKLTAMAAGLFALVGAMFAARFFDSRPESADFLTAGGVESLTEGAKSEKYIAEQTEDECMAIEEAAEEDIEEWDELLEDESRSAVAGTGVSPAAGVVIAPLRVDLYAHPDKQIDMEALFIYDGRCYVQYGTLADASHLIGDHMGIATGLIDEWTEADGYVELAGSVKGDFYSVNGFDSDFVLCMPGESDSVEIYVNNNDLTLYSGADLLKERFKVDGNFLARCMSRQRWFNSIGSPYEMDAEGNEQVWALVEAMFEAPFVYVEDVELPDGAKSIYDTELYHLYLHLDNGMIVHLRLFDGGYVQLDGFRTVCLQVEKEAFGRAIEAMDRIENSLCGVPLEEDE